MDGLLFSGVGEGPKTMSSPCLPLKAYGCEVKMETNATNNGHVKSGLEEEPVWSFVGGEQYRQAVQKSQVKDVSFQYWNNPQIQQFIVGVMLQ